VTITLPERSVVNATRPHAVAGSIETAQRIVDVLLGALGRAFPEEMPAAGHGSMNSITFGGWDERRGRPFNYYETVGGGGGGNPHAAGADAMHIHMTNTLNTPVEALEMAYPLRVLDYAVREGTGGEGAHGGGAGTRRAWEVLAACTVSLLADRRLNAPWGAHGGGDGTPGRDRILRGGKEIALPSKGSVRLEAGDVVIVETAGGGGWGAGPAAPAV
jgi:N-methylhydantoinase B